MKTQEERIDELEQRVLMLEKELSVKRSMNVETTPERHREQYSSKITRKEKVNEHIKPKKEHSKKYALKEAIVGKYIVGALASLLVFIGAISLVILLWDAITPQLKLTMLVVVSILTTTLGYFRILKQRNHINSIILGTGAGLLFISILSSYIYFRYISSNTAFALAGLWSILFILSYKYTRTYFTTVIAYIGSYIAIILGLSLVIETLQLNVILMFVTSISVALIVSGYKWLSKKEQLINLLLSLISYTTVFFWLWIKVGPFKSQFNNMYHMILLSIIIYVIKSMADIIMDKLAEEKEQYKIVSLVSNSFIGLVIGICLITAFNDLGRNIFIILNLSQILFNEIKTKHITKFLTITNTVLITLVILKSSKIVTSIIFGIVALVIMLIVIEKKKRNNDYEELKIGLIVVVMYKLIENLNVSQISIFVYWLSILAIVLVVAKILMDKYRSKDQKNIVILKSLGYVLIIEVVILFVSESIVRINNGLTETWIYAAPIIYTFVTLKIIATLKLGYFKNWFDSDFKWFGKNLDVKDDYSYLLFFITTALMYLAGIAIIAFELTGYNIILMLLSTIAIMVVQSRELFKIRDRSEVIGILEGLKYLIYTWTVMVSLLNFEISSLSTSIAGLVIALASITLGFNMKMKGLRLYGLVVTLLMVFKIITIDIGGQNSITRVVSLIVGGLICFAISIVYNKIDKSMED